MKSLYANKKNPSPDSSTVKDSRQLLAEARQELETAREMRQQAQKYLEETQMKARSEAQRLILQTRMTVRKQAEEMIRQVSEEIQKILADIRVIRITAREELAAQKKLSDAARLRTFTMSLQEEEPDLAADEEPQPVGKEQ